MRTSFLLCSLGALLITGQLGCSRNTSGTTGAAGTAGTTGGAGAAGTTGSRQPDAGGQNAAKPAKALIRFERTACMGTCPVFAAQIGADGKGSYQGGDNAWKKGDAAFQLRPEVVQEVLRRAEEMKFEQMPADEYGKGMVDAPSAILTIKGKTVECVGGECPVELKNLHLYLDRELKQALGVADNEQ